ncbi:hypothetical protein I551_8607 [Mycobacterium ulcerans str. Harvey]|uniref:Uncharacterized protein n=1 Tax=Mycobacterium ulcerans str. Harvey TaxID=1299332 RepID=A0ABN0RAM4_MYCUL|nr:hypothetical protein I551_8607 [Mycobacterium ulcerans str. Harvey]
MRSQPSLLNSGKQGKLAVNLVLDCRVPRATRPDADVQSTDADVVDGHCHFARIAGWPKITPVTRGRSSSVG